MHPEKVKTGFPDFSFDEVASLLSKPNMESDPSLYEIFETLQSLTNF
jgi:hypothetical protein